MPKKKRKKLKKEEHLKNGGYPARKILEGGAIDEISFAKCPKSWGKLICGVIVDPRGQGRQMFVDMTEDEGTFVSKHTIILD